MIQRSLAPEETANFPFQSAKYASTIDRLVAWLNHPERLAASEDADTAGSKLHLVRIHCKKLGCLLEFSRELFSRELLLTLSGELKQLQNWLGRYNDAEVQQQALIDYEKSKTELPRNLAPAVDSLIGLLHQMAQPQRDDPFL